MMHNDDDPLVFHSASDAFAKVSDYVTALLGRASAEGKVVAIPART